MLGLAALLVAVVGEAQGCGWTAKRMGVGGKDLNAVFFVDAKRGWVGGDGGLLGYTEDSGATWVERPLGTEHAVNDIYFVGKDTGFVLAGGSIFGTSDGGHSWRESHKFSPSEFAGATPELYSLRFNGKKRAWVVGSASRGDDIVGSILAITRDGGASWLILRTLTQQELIHIDFVDEKRGWIVGAGGAILHTDDAGESWINQNSGTRGTLYHVDFRNEHRGLVVGERGTILRTEDGGRTWNKIFSPARSTLLSVQFVSDDEVWIVGRGGGILPSWNGGQNRVEHGNQNQQKMFSLFI